MKFLLQIHRIKLQDYIQGALIAPDKYLSDEIEKDIKAVEERLKNAQSIDEQNINELKRSDIYANSIYL